MKKNCKTFGSDEKGNGRASKADVVGEALKDYLEGKNREAWNFALSLCRDTEEADELLQEACYRVLKARKRFDRTRPVKSWLFTVLRNAFIDSRRHKARRPGRSLELSPVGEGRFLYESLTEVEQAAQEKLEREETAARVRLALKCLEPVEQTVLALCDADGWRYVDAARVLGVPRGTVSSRIVRARRKLRAHVVQLGLE